MDIMRLPKAFTLIFILTFTLTAFCFQAIAQDDAQKPNVIIILNDDQGYQDLGCYGSPDIKTPRVDQMAKEGLKFTDFYVASPICSASRAALLTGCYPFRVGVKGVFFPNRGDRGLNPEHETIPEVMKKANYNTMAVGKWHLGDAVEFLPTSQGFDSYYGIPYSNDMYPAKEMKYAEDCLFREGMSLEKLEKAFDPKNLKKSQPYRLKGKVPLMRGEECVEYPADQTTITKRFATESMKFISKSVSENKPFFLYLANPMPHVPLYVSPEFKGKSKRGLYGDVMEELDHNVGRILDHLKELNIDDNTIVIFTSDNGPWLSKGKDGGSALPLFEGKFTHFEGGQRVPAIVRWPARIPAGGVCTELASSMDLLPTLAKIVDAPLANKMSVDGKDIIDLLTQKPGATSPHEYFFFGQHAVRRGEWKYHKAFKFKTKKPTKTEKAPALYNLKNDIGESTNVIDQYPEIAAQLQKALNTMNPNVNQKK